MHHLDLVRNWLLKTDNDPWLMIIDSADNSEIFFGDSGGSNDDVQPLSHYIPQAPHGGVLITSRNNAGAELAGDADRVEAIEAFDEDTALDFMRKKMSDSVDIAQAKSLVELLDYIPLAISQATAYIRKNRRVNSIENYMSLFNKSPGTQARLLGRDGKALNDIRRDAGVPDAVFTTWKISYDHIASYSRMAADALAMMSMLDRQGIPNKLVLAGDFDEMDRSEAIDILLEYSLIQQLNNQEVSYSMHRLVQICTKIWLEQQSKQKYWEEQATVMVSNIVQSIGVYGKSTEYDSILPHARKVSEYTVSEEFIDPQIKLMDMIAFYEMLHGNYTAYREFSQRVVDLRTKQKGAEHATTLDSLRMLGLAYFQEYQFADAELCFDRALEGLSRQLGPSDPIVRETKLGLCKLYCEMGRIVECETLYLQILDDIEKTSGQASLAPVEVICLLAAIYVTQERFDEAAALYAQSVQLRQTHLGPDDEKTMESVLALADVYSSQGQFRKAELLYKRVLTASEKSDVHGYKLTSVAQKISEHYTKHGSFEEAESVSKRALNMLGTSYGGNHPTALQTATGIGYVQLNNGQHDEAIATFTQVLADANEHFSSLPIDTTMWTKEGLAHAYMSKGLHQDAERLWDQILQIEEKNRGSNDIRVSDCLHRLGVCYFEQSRILEAELKLKRAYDGYTKTLGKHHSKTQATAVDLGKAYDKLERCNDAERMWKPALLFRCERFGGQDWETLEPAHLLAYLYLHLERFDDAAKMFKLVLRGQKDHLGAQDMPTLKTLFRLGMAYVGTRRLKLAVKIFLIALGGLGSQSFAWTTRDTEEHPWTQELRLFLTTLYTDAGRYDEVARLRAQLQASATDARIRGRRLFISAYPLTETILLWGPGF